MFVEFMLQSYTICSVYDDGPQKNHLFLRRDFSNHLIELYFQAH